MNIIDSGHQYELDILDGNTDFGGIVLTFVKRFGEHYPGNNNSYPGTTTQEVIRALIDRTKYVNGQIPCVENDGVLNCLETALLLLELRAAREHKHFLKVSDIDTFLKLKKCPKCFHVGCEKHK